MVGISGLHGDVEPLHLTLTLRESCGLKNQVGTSGMQVLRRSSQGCTSVGNVKDAAGVLVPVVNVVATAHRDRHRVLTHCLRQRCLILGRDMREAVQGGCLGWLLRLIVPVGKDGTVSAADNGVWNVF